MSRDLNASLAAALSAGTISPIVLAMFTFVSQTTYVWSGVGTLVWNGNSYLGVGSLGKLGAIVEGVDVKADGTTVELSGIDPVYQSNCLADIQIGAPAMVWFGLMQNGAVVGTPYLVFSGAVDQPTFQIGGETISIQLALENKMSNLARPSMRRYTSADQRLYYPTDIAFGWVEQLNDLALNWGG
jgi:hypothetical protein